MVVGKEMPEFFESFKECFENRMLMNLKGPVDNQLGSYMGCKIPCGAYENVPLGCILPPSSFTREQPCVTRRQAGPWRCLLLHIKD